MHNARISNSSSHHSQWRLFADGSIAGNNVLSAQATTDRNFDARVARPAYVGRHPKVLFDEAHNNAATADGGYRPFVDLITSDGYRVVPNERELSKKTLTGCDILVIANPSGPQGQRDSSAFTEEECTAVKGWIGSLRIKVSYANKVVRQSVDVAPDIPFAECCGKGTGTRNE